MQQQRSIAAIVQNHIGLLTRPCKDFVLILPVFLEGFPFDSKDRDILSSNGCRGVILGRVDIAGCPAYLGPEGDEGFNQYCRLKDRKSTRLNSSHVAISYAVFCLKKKIK